MTRLARGTVADVKEGMVVVAKYELSAHDQWCGDTFRTAVYTTRCKTSVWT